MNDDERDAMIRRLAQDQLQPPPVPREELWARIQAAREGKAVQAVTAITAVERRWAPLAWPVGIAALLALAFGIGRLTAPEPTPVAQAPATEPGRRPTSPAHRLVAAEYLGRTEAFLTDFRVAARTGQPDQDVTTEARRLLGTARLLLDSPVAEDVRLRALLEDLELVLAEIAQLQGERPRDLDLITNGLDQRGTLGRLRSAVPAGGMPALTQGVL
ncbi:MAG: hypothetical protein IPG75_13545 [Gemmatimonadetes bacterium]|jgi:hypothetical protein|nr:hypothetical protein [Gemmatimonadota bacterium]